ncbi:MAG: LacI family transcriptional regulator [Brachymonas sp.]|nr:LacI family transcriptional regulator [Brachymonas sp.]
MPSSRRKGHGRVTLRDVAIHAGVTTMTVSRYLRSSAKIAPETALKVAAALQTTGYTPNMQAGSLASGRSRIVAVIVPNMSHSIFADTLHGLGQSLQAAGLQMLVASSDYSLQQEEQQIRAVLGWAPAALVLTGRHHRAGVDALLQQARASGTPVMEMWDWNAQAAPDAMQVGFDHRRAGELMAQTLVQRGYQDFVFIDSSVREDFRAHERGMGFQNTLFALGQRSELIVAPEGDAVQAGQVVFSEWFAKQAAPIHCGIAFANDMLAVGAWKAAQMQCVACPDQLGLLGFGDFPLARHWGGGLSTLRIDGERIGRECAQLIQAHLRDELSAEVRQVNVMPELVYRAT